MELAEKETNLSARTQEKDSSVDDQLSHDIIGNDEVRINLQIALCELEMNLHNRLQLQHLDDLMADLNIGVENLLSKISDRNTFGDVSLEWYKNEDRIKKLDTFLAPTDDPDEGCFNFGTKSYYSLSPSIKKKQIHPSTDTLAHLSFLYHILFPSFLSLSY